MTNQPSDNFQDAFDSGTAGCRRTCQCGREHYDYQNSYDWEDGELEGLKARSDANPDRCIGHDYAIGTMTIEGKEIVYDCPCGLAQKYENFIIYHAEQIADYLRRRAAELRAKANRIDPTKGLS